MILNTINKVIEKKQFPVFARVIKVYTENNQNYVDCKKMDVDFTESTIIFTKILIPQYWGTSDGGIGIIPDLDSIILIDFIDGNINFPFMKNAFYFIQNGNLSKKGELVLKKGNASIYIDEKLISSDISQTAGLILIDKERIFMKLNEKHSVFIGNLTISLKNIILILLSMISSIEISGSCGCVRNASNYPSPPGNLIANKIIFNEEKIKNRVNNLFK